ncbi:4a-hydroxytetrahydrobiopterin dehydratase [Polynucleobacter sp. AP-Nino-20-G2]|nr:4a-hydroxytetrahydrobiopterin dehydratase [Polynucleobacter sp. AP-Nino-20-G2]
MLQLSEPKRLPDDFDFQGTLPCWQVADGGREIFRKFIFKDFKSAFEFMTLCAGYAEEINHHPDWSNAWNVVSVHLSTHSIKALTELDLAMACAMDQFAEQVLQ